MIPGFSLAQYSSTSHFGYLSPYYPFPTDESVITKEQWRHESYSPNILDFKEGREDHIRYFVDPFLALIKQALKAENSQYGCLIPVPSSLPKGDKRFSRKPRPKGKGHRNRDDRIDVFCSYLAAAAGGIVDTYNIIERIKEKAPKTKLTVDQHVKTLKISSTLVTEAGAPPCTLILVDDVRTDGTTFASCEKALREAGQKSKVIIHLAIGLTENHIDFRPL